MLAVTIRGVGVVLIGQCDHCYLRDRVLLCQPHMEVSYDVCDDVNGLSAEIDFSDCLSHLEYRIGYWQEYEFHEIMVRISADEYKWLIHG